MERVCFTMQVVPEKLEEYLERHRAVWPEMLEALYSTGWRNYSLFARPDGLIVAYLETEDFEAARENMGLTEIDAAWQKSMAPLFAAGGSFEDGPGPCTRHFTWRTNWPRHEGWGRSSKTDRVRYPDYPDYPDGMKAATNIVAASACAGGLHRGSTLLDRRSWTGGAGSALSAQRCRFRAVGSTPGRETGQGSRAGDGGTQLVETGGEATGGTNLDKKVSHPGRFGRTGDDRNARPVGGGLAQQRIL